MDELITKVRLKNWRSHLDSELNFSTGTNALLGHMGSGKSLPYNESVFVNDGIWKKIPIGEIVEKSLKEAKNIIKNDDTLLTNENPNNLTVLSLNYENLEIEERQVKSFIKHKSPKDLIQIKTRSGRRITVTKNHSLLMATKEGIKPMKCSSLKVGDFLLSAKKFNFDKRLEEIDVYSILPDFRNTTLILRGLDLVNNGLSLPKATRIIGIKGPYTLGNWKRRNRIKEPELIIGRDTRISIPRYLKITPEFAKIAGAYIAEGYCVYNEKEHRYGVSFTNYDKKYIEEIKNAWKKTFCDIKSSMFDNNKQIQITGKVIAAFFLRLFGHNAGNKFVPDFIYNLPENELQKLLSMYFEGDGWVVPEDELACSSKSLKLIDGLISCLSKWGIITTIRERVVNGEIYYDLNILPKHIPLFAEHINFSNKIKNEKLKKIEKTIKNRKRWDGIDIIPNFFIKKMLHSLILEYHLMSKKDHKTRMLSRQFYNYMKTQNIGREKLRKTLEFIFDKFKYKTDTFKMLEKIVDSDIFFDSIVEIKEIPSKSEWVYDLSVQSLENFVAGIGNLIVHNSTVLDGTCFALFGTFPTLQTKKLKLNDIIMKKPVEKNMSEVEVQFQLNSSTYSVKRLIEKDKGTSYSEVRENGKMLEAPNSQRVTELVEKLLKVNYELFSKAIYSEQNALDYFLTIPKGQRMKKIDELLMIDKFEKTRAGAVALVNKIAERKMGKQSVVEQTDLDALEKNILELKNTLNNLLSEKQFLQKTLEQVTVEKVKLEQEVSELQKIRQNLEVLKMDEKGIVSALQESYFIIEKLEKNLKGLDRNSIEKNLKDLNKFVREFNQIIEERQRHYSKLQEQASRAKAEVELLKKEKIRKLEAELNEKLRIKNEMERMRKSLGENIDKKIDEKNTLVEKLIGEIESTRIKIKELHDTIEQLSSLKGKCPICESKLTESKKKILIKQKQSQIKSLKESLKKLEERKKLTDKELKTLEEAIDKLDEMLKEIKDFDEIKTELENSRNIYNVLNESAVKYTNELSTMTSEINNYQKKYKNASDDKQRHEILLMQMMDYEDRKNRIAILMKKREAVAVHIEQEEKKIVGRELEKQENWLKNLSVREKEIVTKIVGMDQLIREKEIRLRDFEHSFNTVIKEKEQIKKLDRLIQDLRIFERALIQTQVELRGEFVGAVNYAMNKLWSTLYPYQDFSGIKLSIEQGDYVLQLCERSGRWVNVEGVASGGERSIACLALRIAFSLVLAPQLRLLILDEPTANLDSKSISVLATTLRERIQEFIDQCFLITHQSELEGAVTGSLYRLEREKEKDEVTRVISLS